MAVKETLGTIKVNVTTTYQSTKLTKAKNDLISVGDTAAAQSKKITAFTKELEVLFVALEAVGNAARDSAAKIAGLSGVLAGVSGAAATTSLGKTTKSFEGLSRQAIASTGSLGNFNKGIDQSSKTASLAGRQYTLMGNTLGSGLFLPASMAADNFNEKVEKTNTTVDKTNTKTRTTAQSFTNLGRQMAMAGKSISMTGKSMTYGLTLPMTAISAVSVKMAQDFGEGMNRTVTLGSLSEKQMRKMEKTVMSLSNKHGVLATEAANAYYFISSSGFNASESVEVLDEAIKGSVIGMGSVDTVADVMTSAINAYGKENLKASDALDTMVVATKVGKMENDEFARTIGSLIPLAAELNVSFDEVSGVLANMTNTGADAFKSSTQMRGILTALIKPSKGGSEALAKMGLSAEMLRDSITKRGLFTTLKGLREALGGNEEAMAKIFPNVRGLVGFLNVFGARTKINEKNLAAMNKRLGEGEKAYKWTQKTPEQKLNASINRLKNDFAKLGKTIRPTIIVIIKEIEKLSKAFQKLPKSQQEMIVKVLLLASVLGPLMVGLGAVIQTLSIFVRGFIGAGKAVGWLFKTFKKDGGSFKSFIHKLGFVKNGFIAFGNAIKKAGTGLLNGLKFIGNGFKSFGSFVMNILTRVGAVGRTVLQFVLPKAASVLRAGFGLLPKLFTAIKVAGLRFAIFLRMLPAATGPIGLAITAIALAAYLIIKNWDKVKAALGATWNFMKQSFRKLADFIVQAAKKGFLGPVAWIITNWDKVISFFKKLPGRIWEGMKKLGSLILRPFLWAAGKVRGIFDSIVGFFTKAIDKVTGTISGIKDKIGGVISAVIPGLANGGIAEPGKFAFVGDSSKPEFVISQTGPRERNMNILAMAAQALGVPGFADGGVTGRGFLIDGIESFNKNKKSKGKRKKGKGLTKKEKNEIANNPWFGKGKGGKFGDTSDFHDEADANLAKQKAKEAREKARRKAKEKARRKQERKQERQEERGSYLQERFQYYERKYRMDGILKSSELGHLLRIKNDMITNVRDRQSLVRPGSSEWRSLQMEISNIELDKSELIKQWREEKRARKEEARKRKEEKRKAREERKQKAIENQFSLLEEDYTYYERKFNMDEEITQEELDKLLRIKSAQIKNLRKQQRRKKKGSYEWKQIQNQIRNLALDKQDIRKDFVDKIKEKQGAMGAQFAAFNQERFAVLSSFGGNLRARTQMPMAGGSSIGGGVQRNQRPNEMIAGSEKKITINQEFKQQPQDPHTWTRDIQNEITALL